MAFSAASLSHTACKTPSHLLPGVLTVLVHGGQLDKAFFPDGNTARGGQDQPVDGIERSSQEMLKTHFHAHLAIFYQG